MDDSGSIAIVGVATRFPQEATSTEELWRFLLKGRRAHTPFPEDRIGDGHYHPDPDHGGTFAVKGAHFLSEDPAYFDAPFFSITKGEVLSLDPQQRLVLENVYHSLENAGLTMGEVVSSNTSVYVSGFNHDHLANLNSDPEMTMKYKATGIANALLSNRVSWFFDFKGPSMTLDTACSSSLVALHVACQSLRTGESNMGVVSGVSVMLAPSELTGLGQHGFLSKEGKCFSFDERAEGYARGEGVGTVIVKRLSDAIRDGNTIRAVIRGSGVNQDGRTPGITLPSSAAQEDLMRKVYASAGLGFDETMMVEAHGTGTAAGDPIETSAIARTFSTRRKDVPLYISSIKSGIGHMEGGAGIAGVIKTILVLESGIIAPVADLQRLNPKILQEEWNMLFPHKSMPWPTSGLRRVSINSFGVGGTNAHAILDDAFHYLTARGLKARHNTKPQAPSPEELDRYVHGLEGSAQENHPATNGVNGKVAHESNEKTNGETNGTYSNGVTNGETHHTPAFSIPRIVGFTSFDEKGVQRNAEAQAEYLKSVSLPYGEEESAFLDDFAYTMAKRSMFPWRSYALGTTVAEMIKSLTGSLSKPMRVKGQPKVAFVFTGQGAQWYAMGRELLCYPVYRRSIEDATIFMRSIGAPWSLMEELLKGKADTKVNEPSLAHPSCAALQVALVDLLNSWGVSPSRVVGHSSGEIAAAYCANKVSREDAWRVAYYRGFVSGKQLQAKGAMMAVGLPKSDLDPYLKQVHDESAGELIIACYNSPKNQTVSGDEHKIDALKELLTKSNVFARKLQVKNAYHSAHMKEVADEYFRLLADLPASGRTVDDQVQMFSTVTGRFVEDDRLGAQYWVDNLVSPVRFTEGLTEMCFSQTSKAKTDAPKVAADVIVEIGPHAALQSAIKETLAAKAGKSEIASLPVLNRSSPGLSTVLSTIGFLSTRGYPLDLTTVNESSNPRSALKGGASGRRLLVELPGYSFNHSEKILQESRLTKNWRLRKYPRHDLFGAPVLDWNSETPRWRNTLRLSEQPWLRDHVVTNVFALPGVGYLIAAIEASRQIADPTLKIRAFKLRDVFLKRALIVPDDKDGVETMLDFGRIEESISGSSAWRKFTLSSYNPTGEDWIEHCTGYVAVEYEVAPGVIDDGREEREETLAWQKMQETAAQTCVAPYDMDSIYDSLVTTGLKFGPLFRNLSDVKGTVTQGGKVTGLITVPEVAQSMPKQYAHPHLGHPAMMDNLMHIAICSVIDATGKKTLDRPMVPTFIEDIWVSADLSPEPKHQYQGYGHSSLIAYDKYETDVMIWDHSTQEARISMKGIKATPLESMENKSSSARKLNHEITWVPSLDLLTPSSLSDVQFTSDEDNDTYRGWINKLQLATLLLVTDALDELGGVAPESLEPHMLRYFDWMKQLRQWLDEDKVSGLHKHQWEEYRCNPELKEKLYSELTDYNADGKICVRTGSNIVKVLRKEVDPLHLLFGQDDVLDDLYANGARLGDLSALESAYLKVVAQNSTDLNILEVGGGTGSSTAVILENLAPLSNDEGLESCVGTYTFTDLSAAFFEKAKEKFKDHQDIMDYKVLDAGKDVVSQGFKPASYDFVVAQNVIHTTPDLRKSFQNLKKLLKPGGKLLLQEGVRQDFFWLSVAFGQLSGWWMGVEPIRQWSPWIRPDQWNDVLRESGFSGVDLQLKDRQSSDLHTQSLFIATALPEDGQAASSLPEVAIITTTPTVEGPNSFVQALQLHLEQNLGVKSCQVVHYLDLASMKLDDTVCISVCELERPVLQSLSEAEYQVLQHMLSSCKGLLWLGGDMIEHPEFGMATGLIRTVRWERDIDAANLVTLSVSEPRPTETRLVESLGTLFQQQFMGLLDPEKANGEYVLRNESFFTARLVEGKGADSYLASKFSRPKPVMAPLSSAERPVKLATATPGLLDKLEWVTDESYYQPLGDTEVEVDIRAAGLNFRDLMIAMGDYMAYSMGIEAAGIISRVGPKVTDFKVGDRVVYLNGLDSAGCFHQFGRVDQTVVAHIPHELSYEVAAGLPCVYLTAIYGLRDVGALEKGDKILIHAAAGGVGQAAIHIAKYLGAEIFCTVSNLEKRELLMNDYGIPEDHIFSSRDLSFVKGVSRMTGGKGVDLVLNTLSGEAMRRSFDLLAPFGRFVDITKKDAQSYGKIGLNPFLRNLSMITFELTTMVRHRPRVIKRLLEDMVRLWSEGHIKEAKPTTVMSFSRVEEGLRVLQSGRGMGKIVFVPTPDDLVPIVPAQASPYHMFAEASYVIAGGLGGIGRSTARWMVDHGARHLIFLSGSGNITAAVSEMIADLELKGCEVKIFKCDISDKGRVQEVLYECKSTLPPIKGVIQGAMRLKDGIFANMSYDAFQSAVQPKVQGSWNLHELLPTDMDFFIMLSSATGVLGNRSQANYCTGNTYEDMLAYHRQSKGLAATSIDLGAVLGVGYVAENRDQRAGMVQHLNSIIETMREEEIQALLEYAMDPGHASPPQLVTCLQTAQTYRQRGLPSPTYLSYPLFTHLRTLPTSLNKSGTSSSSSPTILTAALLSSAPTLSAATTIALTAILTKLSTLLSVPPENIDPSKSVSANGVDSLVAMEFRTFLARELLADVPVLDIMGTMSVEALCGKIVGVSKAVVHVRSGEGEGEE